MNSLIRRAFGRFLCVALCIASGLTGFAAEPAPAKAVAAKVTPADNPMLTRLFPSIVRIEAIRLHPSDGRLTKQWTGGSGMIISAAGQVVTNCHVTEDGDYFRCYLFDGSHIDAKRVGQDPLTDIAVLQLDLSQRAKGAPPLSVATFGDSDKLAAGDTVFALGSPGFLAQSVTKGIVSNPSLVLPEQTVGKMTIRGEDVGTLVRWILHDALIYHGNSGGPLVNEHGEIVGVNEIGVFNFSGAIPGNLARLVADNLIKQGRVTRGWSGITVQARLEADGSGAGVVISDVVEKSPAAKAGLLPGDLVVACDGHEIEGAEEKAIAHFNRLETSRLPDSEFTIDYIRGGKKQTAKLKLTPREAAQADDVELRSWGVVVRDLTFNLARDERLPDTRGIWFENLRPAGPVGQAEPTLRRQDVLIAVDGKEVGSVEELKVLTEKLMTGVPTGGTRTVLASVRRDGAVLNSVVDLRATEDHNVTPQARKAWLGAASQPLTLKLATRLGIKADGGARLTRIYPGTQAEAAGLKVGDVILAIDGNAVPARRQEDSDVLARQIRQYKTGSTAVFSLWREGQKVDVNVTLEIQPVPQAEMSWWKDEQLEFSARDIAFDDRVRLQLAPESKGALVESAVLAGWGFLAGLRADDIVEKAGDTAVSNLADLKKARDEVARGTQEWWVLLVRRRGQTLFVEINLKPIKTKSS